MLYFLESCDYQKSRFSLKVFQDLTEKLNKIIGKKIK